ncbi:FxSxx-COOH system tetratricopeptide repeat protein [Actinoplanes philippinensis]|uniref:FxSxx-COOH system tetratricopeptide repeat protein n=1 Tax=Actinoplanes philippinensis TaxID=35752 RepID=UPI0033E2983C
MYTDRRQAWSLTPELEYAQRLTVLNLLNPEAAQRWLHEARQQLVGTETLSREWFVAMGLRNNETIRRGDLSELLSAAVRRMEADGSDEAVREVGELALLPGSDPAIFIPALERLSQASTEAAQTARRVLRTLRRLFPELPEPDRPVGPGARTEIVISYAGADRAWAEWVRWHLEAAGYATELDLVDWAPGTNVVASVHRALQRDSPLVVLLSAAYLEPDRFTLDEWTARLAQRRTDPAARVIPLRVEDVDLSDGLWAPVVVPDLFGLTPDRAVETLVDAVRSVVDPPAGGPAAAATAGHKGPRPPGSLPEVWNLPHRIGGFIGRAEVLEWLRDTLLEHRFAVVHGMSGVGKTLLAVEYAYRFAAEYDVVWWVSAEHEGVIADQFRALGMRLGIVDRETDPTVSVGRVIEYLATRERCLLIFDDAVDRQDVLPWLPQGMAHVLITSRRGIWQQVGPCVELDVLSRAEASRYRASERPDLAADEADQLAEALGDLPLALRQAAGYLSETGMSAAEYQRLLSTEAGAALELGKPVDYPQSLGSAITRSMVSLSELDPAAAAIMRLCSFLAPEPIAIDVILELAQPTDFSRALEPLSEVIGLPLARQQSLARIGAYGLARVAPGTVMVHRLTQAVIRSEMDPSVSSELLAHLGARLAQMRPDEPENPANWPAWAHWLPHLLAADPGRNADMFRAYAHDAVVYLVSCGDAGAARRLAEKLVADWRERLGPDHPSTLLAEDDLVRALRVSGDYQHAEYISEDVWERRRRVLGEEHPDTLQSASDVASVKSDLRQDQEALELQEQVLLNRRRVLGEEHPDSLRSMSEIAGSLTRLGRTEEALTLQEQVLEARRRLWGAEHPDTLRSMSEIAGSLTRLGRTEEALILQEQVLEARRRLWGAEHPDTLVSEADVVVSLKGLGRQQEAAVLQEKLREQRRRVLGEDHPDTLSSTAALAVLYMELGRILPARRLIDEAWQGLNRRLGAHHPSTQRIAEIRRTLVQIMGGSSSGRRKRRR